MDLRRLIALSCVCAVAMAGVVARDVGSELAGDLNGDERVDILDLQAIITQALQGANVGSVPSSIANGRLSVLDFQRILALVEQSGRSDTAPPVKPDNKVCFFGYQAGRTDDGLRLFVEPLEHKEALGIAEVSLAQTQRFDHPDRRIVPTIEERYLFHLTPNAPPVCA